MKNQKVNCALGNKNEIPEFFDWKVYLIMNVDLIKSGIISEKDAVEHYLSYGKKEYRQYFENNKFDYYVYCGEKCASETLYKSLLNDDKRAFKLHRYNEHRFKEENIIPFTFIDNSLKNNETVYIIDSYRNPIERKISSYFNNNLFDLNNYCIEHMISAFNTIYIINNNTLLINFKHEKQNDLFKLIDKLSENLIIDEKHNTYAKLIFKTVDSLNFFCNILDKHSDYYGVLGYTKNNLNHVDYYHSMDEVFRHYDVSESFKHFDFEKKYGLYRHGNMVLIKLRFCDINDWGKILESILGEKVNIKPENLSCNKSFFPLYNEFKQKYKIPRSFIKDLLKDEHFNAFNTVEERRQYIKYWVNRSC